MNIDHSNKWGGWRRSYCGCAGAILCASLILLISISTSVRANPSENDKISSAQIQLFTAAAKNDLDGVKSAIRAGADIRAKDSSGLNAAGIGIKTGHFEIAYFLLALAKEFSEGKDVLLPVLVTGTDARTIEAKPQRNALGGLTVASREISIDEKILTGVAKAHPPHKPHPPVQFAQSGKAVKSIGLKRWKPNITVWAATVGAGREKSGGKNSGTSATPNRLTLSPALQPGRPFILKTAEGQGCFQKGPAHAWFCIDQVKWPAGVRDLFSVRSALYQGSQAIIRYDRGKLTRVFIAFPNKNFTKIKKYFTSHWGPPEKIIDATMALFGKPDVINRRMRWVSPGQNSKKTVVELRQFDDLTDMMPDTRTGFLEIFLKGSSPMFEYVEKSDFVFRTIRLGRKAVPVH